MRSPHQPPPAVGLVRNGVTHDAGVHGGVGALRAAGFAPLVVGVVTSTDVERHGSAAGAPVLRLSPRSPMSRVRDRLRPEQAAAAAPSAPVVAGTPGRLSRWRAVA